MIAWTRETKALWGKLDPKGEVWMPLVQHLEDAADVAGVLWDEWLSESSRRRLSALFRGEEQAKTAVRFLAGIHDIGKAAPDFQCKADKVPSFMGFGHQLRQLGFDFPRKMVPALQPHGLMGQMAVESILQELGVSTRAAKSVAVVIGSHHGRPARSQPRGAQDGLGGPAWERSRREIWDRMAEHVGLVDAVWMFAEQLPAWAQVQLNGLVVMADWIASNVDLFPYCSDDEASRLSWGVEALDLPTRWRVRGAQAGADELFAVHFPQLVGAEVQPLQKAAVQAAQKVDGSCLMVMEAPTGSGKTEAALMAASVLADRFGFGGVMFALPTMATSNPMFSRVERWLENASDGGRTTLNLVHGKAALNEEYAQLSSGRSVGIWDDVGPGEHPEVYVASWFRGRRRAVLASHVVCTIDQVLMGGLRTKHTMLRQLALANKVVVIDEVHAADDFMRVYLECTLTWLAAHGVPVLLLSATLPPEIRTSLASAYARGMGARKGVAVPASTDFPRLTVVTDEAVAWPVRQPEGAGTPVQVEALADDVDTLVETLRRDLVDGGCAAVICSTVGRAQARFEALRDAGLGEVVLVHSKFVAPHRALIEADLMARLGRSGERPERLVVVGTQVLEQSLDVDFDVMVTDVAPMDLLVQRWGRLHRHNRDGRPERVAVPRCYLTGVEDWSSDVPTFHRGLTAVYRAWRLLSSLAVLGQLPRAVVVPDEVPSLVGEAYEESRPSPVAWSDVWVGALAKEVSHRAEQMRNAQAFAVSTPSALWNLTMWAAPAATDPESPKGQASASVRDTDESLEVIVVRGDGAGNARLLDGIGPWSGRVLPRPLGERDSGLAKAAAACTVSLPMTFTVGAALDETLTHLEQYNAEAWQTSPWLAGQLILELDGEGRAQLGSRTLQYSADLGLREVR